MSEIKINSQGEVKLFDSDNSNYIGLKAPATVSTDTTFILPDADGSANNALKTDGSKNLGWVDVTTLVTSGIDWQSTVQTTGFTAASGKGYFCNTTGGAFTATLPASPSAGDIVGLKDYAATFGSNNLTIGRNSSNIQGASTDSKLSTDRASVVLVYVDSTKGWLYVQESNVSNLGPQYVTATGGTITTDGDYKVHTFTGDGTFTVSCAGNSSGSTTVDYLIVAGGGGGGKHQAGGGGAGGLRKNYPNPATGGTPVSASPGTYAIVVGGGGAGQTSGSCNAQGADGAVSSAFSVPSAGGGGGGGYSCPGTPGGPGRSGGSGGGAGSSSNTSGSAGLTPAPTKGAGNTPPVSPSQGNPGGLAWDRNPHGGGGGGGSGAAGCNGHPPSGPSTGGGLGGCGTSVAISGSATVYAGGGGGSGYTGPSTAPANGGGGGDGGHAAGTPSEANGVAGTCNSGGGGGGGANASFDGGNGGSGVVIIRYKYQN